MDLNELQKNWDQFGQCDPMWAILTVPGKENHGWDAPEFFETGEKEIASTLEHARRLGRPSTWQVALDFGCGIGRLTQALARRFSQCHGIDIAPSMIEAARRYNRYGSRCEYHVNAAEDLNWIPGRSIDFIYSNIVLQHMRPEYIKKYIAEFLRILTPTGLAIFQVPGEAVEPDQIVARLGNHSLPESTFHALISVLESPAAVETEGRIPVRVTVRNVGDATWPRSHAGRCSPVHLGNHWLDAAGNLVVNDDARAALPIDVPPGGEVELSLPARAPAAAGDYVLELDMVQEMVSWFRDRGSATARVPVTVTAPSTPNPNITPVARCDAADPPKMEMYGIPREQVLKFVTQYGGRLLDVQPDDSAPGWTSFRYYVATT
jgi:SAM-dependent methyltransferase